MLLLANFPLLLSTLLLSPLTSGHSLAARRCPNVSGMKDFDVKKFSGKWFIIEVYSVVNSCITLDYQPQGDGKLKIAQGRQLSVVDAVGVDHTTNYAGSATYRNNTPSEMTIEWPALGFLGDMSHIVVDSDYDSALTFECQNVFGLLSRVSAAILSRTPDLAETTVEKYKQVARDANIPSVDNFKRVSQGSCRAKGDGIVLDTEDFNLLGLVSEDKIVSIQTKEELASELGIDAALVA